MAKISLELIKELREKTQVGMMDCKEALILAEGNIDKAIEILRKKGASVAAKRAGHKTNNGIVSSYISEDNKIGSLLKISCETDFSANTQDMKDFSKTVSEHISKSEQCCPENCAPECLIEQKTDGGKTVKILLDELIAKISENIKISECTKLVSGDDGIVNAYIHPGSTLGTIIELKVTNLSDTNKPAILQLARDICMQIAVTNPMTIDPSQLDNETLEKEKAIFREQLKAAGKPEQMLDKIIIGKMNKFYEEACLIKQKYIKQDKISIEKYIEGIAKENNCTISIKQFKRFSIGG
jgi:elongation factor Ts